MHAQGVREGGQAEWEAVKAIASKPKTPRHGLGAMRAMGASRDMGIAEQTFQYILHEARDQDTFYYAAGLRDNLLTRRFVADKFKEHFDAVSNRERKFDGGLRPWMGI